MKDICLIREDLTVASIKLCIGEAVIGRGPLLECIDKRVSRNHGLLKLSDDGSILLLATHTSPIYYTPSGNKEREVISEGKSITLQCGDRFALLPDSYCYRVIFTDDKKTENENIMEEKEKINHSINATENDKTWCETLDEKEDTEIKSHKTFGTEICHSLEKNKIIKNKTSSLHARKRILPSWMLEDNVDTTTPQKTKKIQSKTKKKETVPNTEFKKTRKQEQYEKEPDPSGNADEEDHLECTDTADKVHTSSKFHSISDDEQSNPDTSNNQGSVQKIRQYISESEKSDNEQSNDLQHEIRGSAESVGNQQQNMSAPSDVTQVKSPNVTKQKREQCKYGAACYRKNPQHREEFCHPGDEEYEDNSGKPECPYGILCYRKNKLHRQSFKHTTTPAKKMAQRQTKRKKKDENNYESDEDSYDEDDPFINNASSDDYQPTDSEPDSESNSDGEEEGTRRMLKEAKRFVKKR